MIALFLTLVVLLLSIVTTIIALKHKCFNPPISRVKKYVKLLIICGPWITFSSILPLYVAILNRTFGFFELFLFCVFSFIAIIITLLINFVINKKSIINKQSFKINQKSQKSDSNDINLF